MGAEDGLPLHFGSGEQKGREGEAERSVPSEVNQRMSSTKRVRAASVTMLGAGYTLPCVVPPAFPPSYLICPHTSPVT